MCASNAKSQRQKYNNGKQPELLAHPYLVPWLPVRCDMHIALGDPACMYSREVCFPRLLWCFPPQADAVRVKVQPIYDALKRKQYRTALKLSERKDISNVVLVKVVLAWLAMFVRCPLLWAVGR